MEKKIEYTQLYELQDRVLDLIFSLNNEFYLTGGTALHRFYYNLRYSDDLDFFSSADPLFGENIREILSCMDDKSIEYTREVQTKDFQRVFVQNRLRIDFINDRVHREGKSAVIRGMRIDNITNMLTNKITAIMDRDEEKDIFDLFAIAYNETYNWGHILKIANKKSIVDRGMLIERLRIFPLDWLGNLKIIKELIINREEISRMCTDILNEANNSLFHSAVK